jgi:hypothetical protein
VRRPHRCGPRTFGRKTTVACEGVLFHLEKLGVDRVAPQAQPRADSEPGHDPGSGAGFPRSGSVQPPMRRWLAAGEP